MITTPVLIKIQATIMFKTDSDKIIGVYNGGKVAGLRNFLNFLQSSTGFLVCIVLPLVLFFLFEPYNFISIM